jgi:hypothetical protein
MKLRNLHRLGRMKTVESSRFTSNRRRKKLGLAVSLAIQALVPVQPVAIDCHHDVCRGNTAGQDDLFNQILKSLSKFYGELQAEAASFSDGLHLSEELLSYVDEALEIAAARSDRPSGQVVGQRPLTLEENHRFYQSSDDHCLFGLRHRGQTPVCR